MTCKILLPVDGSDGSLRAARHVADIAALAKAMEVHVVNVQPLGDDWMVRRMIKADELARMEKDWAEMALAPALELLRGAGLTPVTHMRQGEVAQTIVGLAEEIGCQQIVMGTRGLNPIGELLMGSVTSKVLHLTKTPLTLVK